MSKIWISSILISLMLIGCTSTIKSHTQIATNMINRQEIKKMNTEFYPEKNPVNVALFTEDKAPHAAYRVIASARVSRYNLLGMQRKENTMHDMMKKLAASIGGDGLIDVKNNPDGLHANVIAFQKILL